MVKLNHFKCCVASPALFKSIFFLCFCVWSSVEAVCGIVQAFGGGFSHNAFFVMTGNFHNPGPFGGFLAISMAVTGTYVIKFRKRHKGLYRSVMMTAACLSFCLCFLVFPASMSRISWAALLLALLLACIRDRNIGKKIGSHPRLVLLACLLAVCCAAAAFFLKKDSAIGRLHIWRIESIAIAEHPFGTGSGTILGTYGKVQEEFFRNNLDNVPAKVVEVAGCPEYAFNEYLHVGVEYGVTGMLLFISVLLAAIVLLYRRGSIYAGGMVAWSVFAFASYPFSVPRINILFGILLAASALSISGRRSHPGRDSARPVQVRSATLPLANLSSAILSSATLFLAAVCLASGIVLAVKSSQTDRFRELYSEGYDQFLSGEYEASLETLSEGAAISSDPIFHVIMGRDYEGLGEYRKAESEYLTAHYMVPCRIYPLVRLTRLYLREGRNREAAELALKAAAMPANEKHLNMVQLRDEMIAVSDSLRTLSR